ncbi:Regulator of ribosome synthesis [Trachipleistophora hominis]|uniref:Ribosome biogenesis regulatory protein n=1 Tax=Trachipleistophora hominis TaxID=72359 RepID=L7JRK3_TRAHO|nr:Regulator of ribosome synthesis [Trachipleistophora hominis]
MQYDLHYLQAYTPKYEQPSQAHINALLTRISQLPVKKHENTKLAILPAPVLVLPHKKCEVPKQKSKWQLFAERKGIRKRRCREVYDEKNDTFLPRYGRFSVSKMKKRMPKEEEE